MPSSAGPSQHPRAGPQHDGRTRRGPGLYPAPAGLRVAAAAAGSAHADQPGRPGNSSRCSGSFYPALLRPVQPAARCRGAAAVGGGRFLQQGAGGQGQCQLGRVRRHRPPRVSPATAASPYNSAGHGHVSTDSGGPALRSCSENQWRTEMNSVREVAAGRVRRIVPFKTPRGFQRSTPLLPKTLPRDGHTPSPKATKQNRRQFFVGGGERRFVLLRCRRR